MLTSKAYESRRDLITLLLEHKNGSCLFSMLIRSDSQIKDERSRGEKRDSRMILVLSTTSSDGGQLQDRTFDHGLKK